MVAVGGRHPNTGANQMARTERLDAVPRRHAPSPVASTRVDETVGAGFAPFDRLLLAQARVEELVLLTGDDRVLAYGYPAQRA